MYCEPEKIVEAVTDVPASARVGVGIGAIQSGFRASSAIKSLKARWTVKPMDVEKEKKEGKEQQQAPDVETKALPDYRPVLQNQKTVIKLEIEYAFANVLYEAMGAAFAPKVAGLVIEAFEKRARSLLGRSRTIE